jgi:hypothetical protein
LLYISVWIGLPLFCHSKQKKIGDLPWKWAVEQHHERNSSSQLSEEIPRIIVEWETPLAKEE